jgi:Sodium/hydrogen exchanger family
MSDMGNGNVTKSLKSYASDNDEMVEISVYFVLFSGLLVLVLILSKLLHDHPKINSYFPEAALILFVGMMAGFIVNLFSSVADDGINYNNNGTTDHATATTTTTTPENMLLSFSPKVFFLYLLPPIIFNSGYHLRRELFYRHIVPICLFAIIGTTVSALTIAVILQSVSNLTRTETFQPCKLLTRILNFRCASESERSTES